MPILLKMETVGKLGLFLHLKLPHELGAGLPKVTPDRATCRSLLASTYLLPQVLCSQLISGFHFFSSLPVPTVPSPAHCILISWEISLCLHGTLMSQ